MEENTVYKLNYQFFEAKKQLGSTKIFLLTYVLSGKHCGPGRQGTARDATSPTELLI